MYLFTWKLERGDIVTSQNAYVAESPMLGNYSQIACIQTACFQREAGVEMLRFNSTWHINHIPNPVEES